MRISQGRRALAAAVMGVAVVAAACGSAETNKAQKRAEQTTTSGAEHDMDHEGGSGVSSATTHGGHVDGTEATHGGGHDDSTGTTHGGGHDDSTGTTHGGGHDDSTGTTNGGHGDDHSATTVGGQGGTTTTHGGHGGHGTSTTSGSQGGTTTTHSGHGTTTTTHNHGGGTTTTTAGCTTTTTNGGHGGHGSSSGSGSCGPGPVQYDDLDPVTKAGVDVGLAVALRYPTAADAQAAGWFQSTVYFPGIAQHNLQAGWLDSNFDPAKPEVLLYGSDGKLVGVNYIVYNGATPPEGFPGSDDGWHEHPALCRSYSSGLVIGGETLTDAECAAIGGYMFSFAGFYLLHVWSVPGYESPEGIFSHENSMLT